MKLDLTEATGGSIGRVSVKLYQHIHLISSKGEGKTLDFEILSTTVPGLKFG